ncbi:MAG: tetratricopeptide repeat protein, partial [Chloroflexi bacterium]|nr:tetratricopeptide repeat protein [Chloroflexota bacterium]
MMPEDKSPALGGERAAPPDGADPALSGNHAIRHMRRWLEADDPALRYRARSKLVALYIARAEERSRDGDYLGALADFGAALEINPQSIVALGKRGVAHVQHKRLDAALADFSHILGLDPKHALTYYNRAYVRSRQGDLQGAIDDLTEAIHLRPRNASYYNNRAVAYTKLGQFAQALADAERALELAPSDALIY